jgi:hypothetical protein
VFSKHGLNGLLNGLACTVHKSTPPGHEHEFWEPPCKIQ